MLVEKSEEKRGGEFQLNVANIGFSKGPDPKRTKASACNLKAASIQRVSQFLTKFVEQINGQIQQMKFLKLDTA